MRRRLPSTQALACFESAMRHESFTKAARELSLTQSAVHRQVTGLERFLGVKLFRRTRHGIALTDAGLSYGRQVARRLDAIERDTLAVIGGGDAAGSLDLAVVPTFAARWLVPRLAEFRALHPDIVVNLETRTRPFLFSESDFDAAIYAGTPADIANWPGTLAIALMPERAVPVCAPALADADGALSPACIARLPLLQQSTRPYAWRRWFEAQGVEGVRDLDGARFDLFSMLAVAAARGMGVALVPRMLVLPELARGELVVACDRPLDEGRAYHLLLPERKAGNPALERFGTWLRGQAAQAHEAQAGNAGAIGATRPDGVDASRPVAGG